MFRIQTLIMPVRAVLHVTHTLTGSCTVVVPVPVANEFDPGTSGYIEPNNNYTQAPSSGGVTCVIADAIMFEPQP